MLGLARGIVQADRQLRAGHWIKSELVGYHLRGKRLGIVGLGSIGTRVAQLGLAWGMRPLGCVDRPSDERRASFAAQGIDLVDFDRVLAEGDFVSIHVPLGTATRNLFGAAELGKMT